LRIFRPDLITDQIKRIVSIYFDETFVNDNQVAYSDIKKQVSKMDVNLMLVASNQDAQNELMRMRQVLRIAKPMVYKSLNAKNL